MQTTEKLAHLKAMGIEVWCDRASQQGEPFSFYGLSLGGQRPILILADLDPFKCAEEEALLEAIAKALGFEAKARRLVLEELDSLLSGQILIVMGDKLAQCLSGKSFILTYAPAQLLAEPKLKAKTWQAIRHLKV